MITLDQKIPVWVNSGCNSVQTTTEDNYGYMYINHSGQVIIALPS